MKQPATKNKRINIWQYQFILSRRLAWWGALSFAVGIPTFLVEPVLRGFGIQAMVWGLINAAIAVGGSLLVVRRRKALPDPQAKDAVEKEADKLRRLLWWMIPLDVIYVIVGLVLAFTWGRKDSWWMGTGIGVVAQGLFLLGFDWYHAKNVPTN
jgi:archaellum biogenesis protein FlaJ (TadC family)